MLQRIQSVFLFIAALFISTLFIPLFAFVNASINTSEEKFTVLNDSQFNINDNILLLSITIALILLNIGIIFLFKNRGLQINLSKLSIFLTLLFLLYSIFLTINLRNSLIVSNISSQFGLGFVAIAGSMLFIFLAIYNIKKDDKIVKSMDRLR